MPRRFATSSAHFFSSGSSAERNLLAHLSMGPSMVTSTVSLALAESFSTSGGILKSWARATIGNATSTVHNSVFVFLILMDLLLHRSVLFFVHMDLVHVDLVDFRFRELQLTAGDAERQHQLLFRGFAFGALTLEVAV